MERGLDDSVVGTPGGGRDSMASAHLKLEAESKAFERDALSHFAARLRAAQQQQQQQQSSDPSADTSASATGGASAVQSDAEFSRSILRVIRERYRRVAKIGQGSFGEVYIVYDTAAQTYLTMKRVQLLRGAGRRVMGICNTTSRELNLLRVLSHPNIVALHDYHVVPDGTFVLLMPVVAHDLASLVRLWRSGGPRGEPTAGRMPLPTIKCIFLQLLTGVAYLHRVRVIHRDLKLSNVMLDERGIVKIIDFGWARFCPAKWRGAMTGPPCPVCYRPPEVLLGGEHATRYDASVDLWCCACILFEMLTGGKMLVSARSEAEAVAAIVDWLGSPSSRSPLYYGDPAKRSVTFRQHSRSHFVQRCQTMQIDSGSIEIMEEMFQLEPKMRKGAAELAQHRWFKTPPLPCEPHEISLPAYNMYRWLESRRRT